MTKTYFLVVKADRSVRVAAKPRLAADEVAIRLNVTFPPSWGSVVGEIDIVLPDQPVIVEGEMYPEGTA